MLKKQIWNKPFIMLLLINTVIFLGFNMSTSGFPAYVAIVGSSNISTGLVTALSAIASLLMRPFAGSVLDKRNERLFTLLGLLLLSSPLICVFSVLFPVAQENISIKSGPHPVRELLSDQHRFKILFQFFLIADGCSVS